MPDYVSLLARFGSDIEKRLAAEEAFAALKSGPDPRETGLRTALDEQLGERDAEQAAIQAEYESVHGQACDHFSRELAEAERIHRETLKRIETEAAEHSAELERKREDSEWVISSVLDDDAEDSPVREFEKFKSNLQKSRDEQVAEWTDVDVACRAVMEERGWSAETGDAAGLLSPQDPPTEREATGQRFHETVAEIRRSLEKLRSLLLPRLFIGLRSVVAFAVLTLATGVPVYLLVDPAVAGIAGDRMQPGWIGLAAGAGAVGGLLLTVVLFTLGSMRQSEIFRHVLEARAEAGWLHQHWLKLARAELERRERQSHARQKQVIRERDASLKRYQQAHANRRSEIETSRETQLRDEHERYGRQRHELTSQRDAQLALLDEEHQRRRTESAANWENRTRDLQEQLARYTSERQRTQAQHWTRMKSDWEQACRTFDAEAGSATKQSRELFRPWEELVAGRWHPPRQIPAQLRLGEYLVDLNEWEGAVPEDVRMAPRVTSYRLPATLSFPNAASLLLKTPDLQARQRGIQALQSLMLRLLTLIPPGKLRFTLIDPVGLGESFGGFMHLADFDELMVTSRIWTESGQIEARLADLSEHMENVFQKYLRNEFQTIEEYNESAGEVAEPYHFLVISDFPSKFSEIAARRLVSIVNSGPRCGVYTLMSLDPGKQQPNNFELSDVEPHLVSLEWRGGAFHLQGVPGRLFSAPLLPASPSPSPEDRSGIQTDGMRSPEASKLLSRWPIEIDVPPEPERFTAIVRMVGEASKDARRVEVSFDRITPDAREVWSGDSRSELTIPLGRAGATKLQQMRLGKGTSQHMLVAGKTGSGKSTFLHILVTNLALHYSPDEVNFYLIDFKKGVEFKDYATFQLPHARVIAIESDREFGISALQKLDDVLQERGELFRRHGVQDIAGFRNANPHAPLPRILLIVDEFQEFFTEDDKLGQTSSLLLDRLVRQGRAFGIHVILGSQTLGGAYSLARSTLGQVAVRVALQCSESDAHLILSEENSAARLLTRPGEAIYNDANGMMEGNHPFQIAWLSDDEREQALGQIRERALRSGMESEPPIVFEGNIPSDLTRNPHLTRLAGEFSTREDAVSTPTVWLGDAVEIKPATSITFQRQTGSNLLIVGQDAEAALGIMAAALMMIAAQGTGAGGRVSEASAETGAEPAFDPQSPALNAHFPPLYVLNGSPDGAAQSHVWQRLADLLPVDVRIVTPGESRSFLEAMTTELKRRDQEPNPTGPPVVTLVYHVGKFRDLRRAEDDFGLGGGGFGGEEKPPEPGKLFADLLAQGPALGMHSVIWCDSYNNLDRWFSRQTLRELEMRIAFQMNASDSSNLIDSPAASRLGTHRALLYREETGTAEKFRPYGLPDEKWLELFANQMANGPDSDIATDLEEFSIL